MAKATQRTSRFDPILVVPKEFYKVLWDQLGPKFRRGGGCDGFSWIMINETRVSWSDDPEEYGLCVQDTKPYLRRIDFNR